MPKEQDYLNDAIYDKGQGSLDNIEKPKKIKKIKKNLGYTENILDTLFKKKKIVKKEYKPKKENKKTSLSKTKKGTINIFKKKKDMTFFNKL
jgi:chromatin segregation and condensation protein Rec8/ScpA/Scc1 (kleisin family)